MLFNSYEFIFAFLPLTVAAFYVFGRISRTAALRWLIGASLVFYAWWRPLNVAIILPSIVINFMLARRLLRLAGDDIRQHASRATLIAGIAFNIAFLGYFKYTNFLVGAANDVLGTDLIVTQIILPLGISFITFQKIAFLIDVHGRRVQAFTLGDYCLFVLFFPQLIAGPIVHYREVIPQFERASCRLNTQDLAVGITIFCLGLFQKSFLADGIAPYVTMIFDQAAAGGKVAMLPALMAAIGYTLQIYFDFSGYSDMAIGIARMFGIKLPANFNSPLRASSIIDYWLRWHMTLTRFLTAYIYNPLLLRLTRPRLARGLPVMGRRDPSLSAFLTLLTFPTIVTMAISGLWHGAGYTFIVWGLLHGLYLTINHAWRLLKLQLWPNYKSSAATWLAATALTLAAVVVGMVFFRAPTLRSAIAMLAGMIGLHGAGGWEGVDFTRLCKWSALLFVVAMFLPNTTQLLSRYEPALGVRPPNAGGAAAGPAWLTWNPSLAWGIVVACIVFTAILSLAGPSEFLYWQF